MNLFSQKLLKLFDINHCKAADVARAASTSRGTVSEWLSGVRKPHNIKVDNFLQMCKFLRADPYWLLYGKSVEEPKKKNHQLDDDELSIIQTYRSLDDSDKKMFIALSKKLETVDA